MTFCIGLEGGSRTDKDAATKDCQKNPSTLPGQKRLMQLKYDSRQTTKFNLSLSTCPQLCNPSCLVYAGGIHVNCSRQGRPQGLKETPLRHVRPHVLLIASAGLGHRHKDVD